jgi:hypothetical protein
MTENSHPLAPNMEDFLRDADESVTLMAATSLPTVAQTAAFLAIEARDAGAADIANAADDIGRAARRHGAVTLTSPMQRLIAAIEAERKRREGS